MGDVIYIKDYLEDNPWDWTDEELWAFEKCGEEQCSSSSGPDEDMMREYLRLHISEYPGPQWNSK